MKPPRGALRRARALLVVACLWPGLLLGASEVSPPKVGSGQVEAAARVFEEALAAATGDNEWLAAARGYAELLRRRVSTAAAEPSPAQLERAADLYREMLARSVGEERLVTSNNYAATLLELGRPDQATRALAAIEGPMAAETQKAAQPVYFFNYGQALEQAGRDAEAARRYEQALAADARFAPPAEALFRLALSAEDAAAGVERATALLGQLIEQKAFAPAEGYLRQALLHGPWLESDVYPELLAAWVRYLTAAAVGPDMFATSWEQELTALDPASAQARAQVAKIREGYLDDLPVMLDPEWARYHWDVSFEDDDHEYGAKPTSSAFITMIADGYAGLDQLEQAFPRYVLAWNLDRNNGDAALQMVNLLLEWPERLDPDGSILDELILWLFEGKGDAYLGRDWEDILRFHVLLGTIFERRGQWGPADNPRSALFQWDHALAAQERLLADGNAEAVAVPGLHIKVASAYQALGEDQQAWQHYADAADGFVAVGNNLEAREALVDASRLGYAPSVEQMERFGDLQEALGEVEEQQTLPMRQNERMEPLREFDARQWHPRFQAPELR